MLRADHVVFPVWAPEESLKFYGDVLGLPLVETFEGPDWGGKAWLMMSFALEGGAELVLVALRGASRPAPDGLARDVRHYAFSVEDRVAQAKVEERLAAAGVETWDEDHGDRHSIYFEDPNGVVLEVTTPPSQPACRADPDAALRALAWMTGDPTR